MKKKLYTNIMYEDHKTACFIYDIMPQKRGNHTLAVCPKSFQTNIFCGRQGKV